ncbi:MAG: hypothetical protein FD174_4323 [Geobacteraceae bacterium]|nr:MAG: hypothetical protein FD174_4323 [Geobacteraceae bacterium]
MKRNPAVPDAHIDMEKSPGTISTIKLFSFPGKTRKNRT